MFKEGLNVVTQISTPLMLGGLVAVLFFGVVRIVVGKVPNLSQGHGFKVVIFTIKYFFWLALATIVLGFVGYVVSQKKAEITSKATTTNWEQYAALGQTIQSLTNTLAFQTPDLHIDVNGQELKTHMTQINGGTVQEFVMASELNVIDLPQSRRIQLRAINVSGAPAERLSIMFFTELDTTKLIAEGWRVQPAPDNQTVYSIGASESVPEFMGFTPPVLQVSTNVSGIFSGQITVYANRSKTYNCAVAFKLPP